MTEVICDPGQDRASGGGQGHTRYAMHEQVVLEGPLFNMQKNAKTEILLACGKSLYLPL